MKPASFAYHAPKTVDEAVAKLAELGAARRPYSGRRTEPGADDGLSHGAARASHRHQWLSQASTGSRSTATCCSIAPRACATPPFIIPQSPGPTGALLAKVVAHIAHYPIRLRGTFCGSLAHADPASEWCLTAVTLGADIVALSARGPRVIAADDYFEGMMMTTLAEDELLREVRLPLLPARCALRLL